MPEEIKHLRIHDFAKKSWFKDEGKSSLWVSTYSVFRVPKKIFASGPIIIEFSRLTAILLYGTLNYLSAPNLSFETKSELLKLRADGPEFRKTEEGTYLVLITPFDVDGIQGNEQTTNIIIKEAVALLYAQYGRNIAFSKVYDNKISMTSDQTSCSTPSILNPLSMEKPDINHKSLLTVTTADRTINNLEEKIRSRVKLSLRWHEASLIDDGIDSFIKSWVAIEILAMPDTSNIKPIHEQLSEIYGISFEQAKDTFNIGRLASFRNDIVHNGRLIPIHSNLIDYMHALYVDLLLHHLGLQVQKRAKRVLDNPNFNLTNHLNGL